MAITIASVSFECSHQSEWFPSIIHRTCNLSGKCHLSVSTATGKFAPSCWLRELAQRHTYQLELHPLITLTKEKLAHWWIIWRIKSKLAPKLYPGRDKFCIFGLFRIQYKEMEIKNCKQEECALCLIKEIKYKWILNYKGYNLLKCIKMQYLISSVG